MKTNFAYIDDVMERAVAAEGAEPTILLKDRDAATKNARKLIGGFRVFDKETENKELDLLIAKRKEIVERFRQDRATIRNNLQTAGITPLAICPKSAWHKICRQAGLFIFSPDSKNRVGFTPLGQKQWTAHTITKFAKNDWKAFLNLLFPDGVAENSATRATLILPDPPADVAEILIKAQKFTLAVAAVPEAIRFAETPAELLQASSNPKDLWAQEQGYADYADWVKRDPIIFTQHGSAIAVIAQFGEFPIEKQIVDAVVSTKDLLSEEPTIQERTGGFFDAAEMYAQQILDLQQETIRQRMITIPSRGVLTYYPNRDQY